MKKKIGIIVGRFQVHELHQGHTYLIGQALEKFDEVRVFLGVTKGEIIDLRNPLPFEARKTMLLEQFPQLFNKIDKIEDIGNWKLWVESLDNRLKDLENLGDIFIFGSRDSVASRYKEFDGKYEVVCLEELPNFSGTAVREDISNKYQPIWNKNNRKLAIWMVESLKRVNSSSSVGHNLTIYDFVAQLLSIYGFRHIKTIPNRANIYLMDAREDDIEDEWLRRLKFFKLILSRIYKIDTELVLCDEGTKFKHWEIVIVSPDFKELASEKGLDSKNPLINPLSSCYRGLIPFDSIKPEHILPALEESLKFTKESHELVYGFNEEPTFDNTLGHYFDYLGFLPQPSLGDILSILSVYSSFCLSDEILDIEQKANKLYSDYYNSVRFDDRLHKKLLYVKNNAVDLLPNEIKLLDEHIKLGKNKGFDFSSEGKAALCDITSKMLNLRTNFDSNVTKATNEVIITLDSIPGLSDRALDNMKRVNEDGSVVYDVTLQYYSDIIEYCTDRELRKRLYDEYCFKNFGGKYDNRQLCLDITSLKLSKANLFGYSTAAEHIISCSDKMLSSVEQIRDFLFSLREVFSEAAVRDISSLVEFVKSIEGPDFELKAWDMVYYTRLYSQHLYNINSETMRKYFQFDRVIEDVFELAKSLYGVEFHWTFAPVYNEKVKCYSVLDNDHRFLGFLYVDPYLRSTKSPGAWHSTLVDQGRADISSFIGEPVEKVDFRPIGIISLNLDPDGSMCFSDVETLLHEFGHALHDLFSDVDLSSQSGTNVARDFVEFPSQFMEYFAREENFLLKVAIDKDGKPMPEDLRKALISKANFMKGIDCWNQLRYGILDYIWATCEKVPECIEDVEKTLEEILPMPDVLRNIYGDQVKHSSTSFSHIFSGGYALGYYSYLYSEILAIDAYNYFSASGKSPLENTELANKLRECVLSKGSSENPMELYKKFRGQEPDINSFLVKKGFKK